MLATAKPLSRRESSKAGRRDRIASATHELLREVGMEGASLELIARRAHVSRTTVFNLFGSKGAVLTEVFDRDLKEFEALVAAEPSADSLARIFDALKVAERLYEADPLFYRATMWTRASTPGDVSYAAQREPRIHFWRRMVEAAEADGFLSLGPDAAAAGVLLIQLTAGALSDWVSGVIPAERLRRETAFGFAAVLLSFATETSRPRLETYRDEALRELRGARSPLPGKKGLSC